ncbi:MAG: hypothetical protein MK085_07230, partial [Phycisphaerales bacterium]|nr:hypothetical protein [Phycisphaerales bacterium]
VLGIVSLVVCAPVGIAAWIMGRADLQAIAAGQMDPQGKDTTQVGMILGIISCALFALSLVIGVLVLVFSILLPVMAS